MIEINLLPPELRKKEPKFKIAIPKETLYLFSGAIIFFLVLIHIILMVSLSIRKAKYANLKKQWQKILPEKKKIDILKQEHKNISNKIKSINRLTKKGRINWAKKLNIISDILPDGVWLRRIDFSEGELIIEGSSVSLKGEEVMLVNKFTSALKNNNDFYSDFKDLDIDSIKRRQIKNIEVADFILTAKLREK
jgi:Tfp pilus assembly protein PilN